MPSSPRYEKHLQGALLLVVATHGTSGIDPRGDGREHDLHYVGLVYRLLRCLVPLVCCLVVRVGGGFGRLDVAIDSLKGRDRLFRVSTIIRRSCFVLTLCRARHWMFPITPL